MPHRKKEKERPHGWVIELPEEKRAKTKTRMAFAIMVAAILIGLTLLVVLSVRNGDPEINKKFIREKGGVTGFIIKEISR